MSDISQLVEDLQTDSDIVDATVKQAVDEDEQAISIQPRTVGIINNENSIYLIVFKEDTPYHKLKIVVVALYDKNLYFFKILFRNIIKV